jgi:hypothetical protein
MGAPVPIIEKVEAFSVEASISAQHNNNSQLVLDKTINNSTMIFCNKIVFLASASSKANTTKHIVLEC